MHHAADDHSASPIHGAATKIILFNQTCMLLNAIYNGYACSQTWGVHFQIGHSRLLSLCHQAYSYGRHTYRPSKVYWDGQCNGIGCTKHKDQHVASWSAILPAKGHQISSCSGSRCGEGRLSREPIYAPRSANVMIRIVHSISFIQSTQL